jgi:DNA-binding NtrC family response regulator
MLVQTAIDSTAADWADSSIDPAESLVLVAGDSVAAVRAMAAALESAGYRVATASSCARIADHLEGTGRCAPIGLLVLDGTERPWVAAAVIAALRDSGRDIPVLLVVRESGPHAETRRLGVREIFEWPLRPDALRSAVARVLLAERDATSVPPRRAPRRH